MNCKICNEEMIYGKVYIQGSILERILRNDEHLYFEEYSKDSKPIKLLHCEKHCKGCYCQKCDDVWIKHENYADKCITCGNEMQKGELYLKKGFTKFNYKYVDFKSLRGKNYKILDNSLYVRRAYHCIKCGSTFFSKKDLDNLV